VGPTVAVKVIDWPTNTGVVVDVRVTDVVSADTVNINVLEWLGAWLESPLYCTTTLCVPGSIVAVEKTN
jgi:hypothetical protein